MTALPGPVARYRELARTGDPAPFETVAIETAGTMRRAGLPPIPLRIRMAHRLGHAFVHEIRIGFGRLSFAFGLDACVDGRGLMQVGPTLQIGPELDQGALIALWGEALVFPSSWDRRADVRWDPVDASTARLVVAWAGGELPIRVTFDHDSGLPIACDALRHKGAGPLVGWRGTYGAWRRFPSGVLGPGRFGVTWADEPRPWLELGVERLDPGAPVDGALDAARRALARVPGRGDRPAESITRTRP